MGIQNTLDITLEDAIARIRKIATLITNQHYRDLQAASFEDAAAASVIDCPDAQALAKKVLNAELLTWTDKMITEVLERPFYRFSYFENYLIKG